MSTERTNGSGQFSKGTSGNPSGRPPGSRNRATLLMESLLEGAAEQLTQKAIELALGGDRTALRLCLDRLIPPCKDRPIHLSLPSIENVPQVSLAMAKVSTAIGEGEITPTEGAVLSNILAAHKDVLVAASREERIGRVGKYELGKPTEPFGKAPWAPFHDDTEDEFPLWEADLLRERAEALERGESVEDTPQMQEILQRWTEDGYELDRKGVPNSAGEP